jgi:hypothetical protein
MAALTLLERCAPSAAWLFVPLAWPPLQIRWSGACYSVTNTIQKYMYRCARGGLFIENLIKCI